MPIYQYNCKKHGEFEELLSIREKTDERPCPKCKDGKLHPQVIGLPAPPIFHGGGFHCTSYPNAQYKGT